MQLLFASHNQHKVKELNQLLLGTHTIISLADVGINEEIPETGKTFKENALLKAKYCFQKVAVNCFADDSGLQIEALNNEPGVYSARYAGDDKNDSKNIEKVLSNLENQKNRKARFLTVICLLINDSHFFFEGIIDGIISNEIKGDNGFGYDSIFIPNGYKHTFAEMSSAEKNAISHRAIATGKLIHFLKKL